MAVVATRDKAISMFSLLRTVADVIAATILSSMSLASCKVSGMGLFSATFLAALEKNTVAEGLTSALGTATD